MSLPLHTAGRIEQLLQESLQPSYLEVRDESAAHAGHANAGRGHYRLKVVSKHFDGLKPLQRHRLVNAALSPLFETELHALAMETLTPEEYSR
jgi:BolA protein